MKTKVPLPLGELHGPFFQCPNCKGTLATNDTISKSGYCPRCHVLIDLSRCKKVELR